jgi:hypothetical protein
MREREVEIAMKTLPGLLKEIRENATEKSIQQRGREVRPQVKRSPEENPRLHGRQIHQRSDEDYQEYFSERRVSLTRLYSRSYHIPLLLPSPEDW